MAIVPQATREEEFDALLADFFDWTDHRRAQGGLAETSSDTQSMLHAFVAAHPTWRARHELIDELRAFLHDAVAVEQLASQVTLDWIGASVERPGWMQANADLAAEQLPREFGDYELVERIGQGGMGVVYRARQRRLGRIVCLKMLPPGLLDPERMRRLANEARLAASLQHEGIVTVFDAGEFAGQPYIAMEFVAGETLAQKLARGPLESTEAVRLLDAIAAAVEHAHRHGVLHRDLKPANVLLEPNGRPRVADFGLARPVEQTHSTDAVAGTPSYMAPEQATGQRVDERTDVYGLGAILYQMLTGRPPHVGNTPLVTLRLVETEEPLPPARLRPGLSKDVDTICRKCLEKRPAGRYPSVAELREDLARFERHEPISARPIGAVERALRWVRRHAAAAAALSISVTSLVLLVVIGAVALIRTNHALEGTREAERQLAAEKKRAIAALYRSQIARVGQSLDQGDLDAARQTLDDISRTPDLAEQRGLEYRFLERRAYPEAVRMGPDVPATVGAGWFRDATGFVTVGADGALRTWTADAQAVAVSPPLEQVPLLAVDRTDDTIATVGAGGVVRLWQRENLAPLATIESERGDVRTLVWHPDGRALWLVDGGRAVVRIDVQTAEIDSVPLSVGAVDDLAISADGNWLVVVTQLRRLAVFDLAAIDESIESRPVAGDGARLRSERVGLEFEPLAAFDLPGLVSMLAWSDNAARFAAADDSGTIGIWAVERPASDEPAVVKEIWRSAAGEDGLTALAWSQGELLWGNARGGLRAIDAVRLRTLWRQPAGPVREIIAAPNSDQWLIVEQGDGRVSLWDRSRLSVGRPIAQSDIPIRAIALQGAGKQAAWRDVDGQITVFDVERATPVRQLDEPALGATAIAWNRANDLLGVGRSGGVILFDAQAGVTRERLAAHRGTVWALAFSPDGKLLASGAEEGTAIVTELATGKRRALEGHRGEVRALAFRNDGKTIATADASATVRVFDREGRLVFRRDFNGPSINSLAFMAEHSLAIGEGSGRISILEASNGEKRAQWHAHQGAVWSVAAAGEQLLSAGQDGVIALWDSAGELELTLAHLRSPVWGLAYSEKANRLLVCTTAGDIHEWTWAQSSAGSPRRPDVRFSKTGG